MAFSDYTAVTVGFGLVVMIPWYIMLLWLGTVIETTPAEKRGGHSLASPIPATRIFGMAYLIIYAVSAYVFMTTYDTIYFVLAMTGMIAAAMFMGTSVVFSAAVLNAIKTKNKQTPTLGV